MDAPPFNRPSRSVPKLFSVFLATNSAEQALKVGQVFGLGGINSEFHRNSIHLRIANKIPSITSPSCWPPWMENVHTSQPFRHLPWPSRPSKTPLTVKSGHRAQRLGRSQTFVAMPVAKTSAAWATTGAMPVGYDSKSDNGNCAENVRNVPNSVRIRQCSKPQLVQIVYASTDIWTQIFISPRPYDS